MQPDQQKNYWEGTSGSDEPTEMYAPEATDDDVEPVANQANEPENNTQQSVDDEPVHWSASEYIAMQKNGLWFVVFAIVVIALVAADIFFIKSYTFSVLVVVMAAALVIYTRRPPRAIDYTLSAEQGLYIGEKLYHFSEFKAFGLISDRGNHSIVLIPIKRFALAVSVYFPEEAGEKIVDILGLRLPMQDVKLDAIDVIVRKLRL